MRELNFSQVQAMKGNGSSMRAVLKYFFDKGAAVQLIHENLGESTERYFLVKYEELEIPLRAYNLNFYSAYNSHMGREITSDKLNSYGIFRAWDIPTPETLVYRDSESAADFMTRHTMVVVKPGKGAHGDGITTGIKDAGSLSAAIKVAQEIDPNVLIQQQVEGEDHRLLFIDYEFAAAVKRTPATVNGDGKQTIRELVEARNASISALWANIRNGDANADETRGSISKTPLDEIISARGAGFLDRVPAPDEAVQLLDKANVSLGGETHDITDKVNSDLTDKLSRMLRKLGVPLCGIDVLSANISSPPEARMSYVIELNAAPGLRLHELPTTGDPRNVCAQVAESLINYYRSQV